MIGGLNQRAGKPIKQRLAKRCGMILRSGTKIWIPAFARMTMEDGALLGEPHTSS
jgi:hypothetical protein